MFCKWYNSVPFLHVFGAKKYQYHLTEISPESSAQIVSALGLAVTWDDNIENYPYFELFFDIP